MNLTCEWSWVSKEEALKWLHVWPKDKLSPAVVQHFEQVYKMSEPTLVICESERDESKNKKQASSGKKKEKSKLVALIYA